MAGPDLRPWPKLDALYGVEFREDYGNKRQSRPDYLYRVLCDGSPDMHELRDHMEQLLRAASAVGILDSQTEGRLRSGDQNQFRAAMAELECSEFLHARGFPLKPRPQGAPGRSGDLEIALASRIFVEVKAVLDRPREQEEDRLTAKLWRYAEEVKGNYLVWLSVATPADDFRGPRFRQWLEKRLAEAGKSEVTATYTDRSGLQVAVEATPCETGGRVGLAQSHEARFLHTPDYLRASVDAAYEQVPDDGRPTLIVLRPFLSFGARDKHMLSCLYGTEQWRINLQTKEVASTRARDGLMRAGHHERMSAVALLLGQRLVHGARSSLDVCHHPFARYPLDSALLRATDIRHFVAIDRHHLVWKE